MVETTVLNDLKDVLNVAQEDSGFDSELLTDINGAVAAFSQVGTLKSPVPIVEKGTTWDALFDTASDNETKMLLRQYVYLKTKVLFDPPQPTTLSAMNEAAKELLWRSEQLDSEGGE